MNLGCAVYITFIDANHFFLDQQRTVYPSPILYLPYPPISYRFLPPPLLPITLSKQPNHVRTTSSAVKHRIPPNHQKHRPSKHPHPKTTLLQTKRHPPHPPHPPCHLRPPRPRIPNLQLHPHPHSHQNTHILQLRLHCPRGPLQQLQIRLPSRRLAPTGLSQRRPHLSFRTSRFKS